MDWDLSIVGLMALGSVAIAVGLVTQLLAGADAPSWLWLSVSGVYFVIGVLLGEAWFGWLTVDDLSSEDVLLLVLAPIPAVVLVTRSLSARCGVGSAPRPRRPGRPRHPRPRAL